MAITGSFREKRIGFLSQSRSFAQARQFRPLEEAPHRVLVRDLEWQAVPWWLWWNILSGDAPTIALAWAILFTKASGGKLSVAEAGVLVLAVWIIYVVDRLLDGWREREHTHLRERHLFCARHRFLFICLAAVAGVCIPCLTVECLRTAEIIAGAILGVILIFYLTIVHAAPERFSSFWPKEIAVGFLFACGATLPCWSKFTEFSWRDCIPFFFFALLCSLNCISIECWENHRRGGLWRRQPNPLLHWADSRINCMAAILACGALTAAFRQEPRGSSPIDLLAVSLGALLILLLNCARNERSETSLRVLADAALVVPALIALVIRA